MTASPAMSEKTDETAEVIKALHSMVRDPNVSVEHSPVLIRAARLLGHSPAGADPEVGLDVPRPEKASGVHTATHPISGWQPIETAPKDGHRLLGYTDEWRLPFPIRWDVRRLGGAWIMDNGSVKSQPTHWMPMPDPPTDQDATRTSSDKGASTLCEDCPPVGYPTAETRCAPCPRRLNPSPVDGGRG